MKVILFALFFGLLMVGCGEDSKKPGSDSPESRQVFVETIDLDDTKILDDLIAEAIDNDKFQMRSDDGEQLRYAHDKQTPYSGWAKSMHSNGQVAFLARYKGGKRDGPMASWFEKGQKKAEGIFKNDKEIGLWTFWHENGHKNAEENYKNGKFHGLNIHWYANGQKEQEGVFKDGKKNGPAKSWYRNGRRRNEGNFNAGKLNTSVLWKPNGERCPVSNPFDGSGFLVRYNDDGTELSRAIYQDGEFKAKVESESDYSLRESPLYKPSDNHKKVTVYPKGWEDIASAAIVMHNLSLLGEEGNKLFYALEEKAPYSGWAKRMHENGQIHDLLQCKEGKLDGINISWNENGNIKSKWTFENGNPIFNVSFYQSGKKQNEIRLNEGKLSFANVWKPNGEKCLVTNVKDGNGVLVSYKEDGIEKNRKIFKDGKVVRD